MSGGAGAGSTQRGGGIAARLKVCVLGDAGAGKTSLVQRLVDDAHDEDARVTIGIDFRQRVLRDNAASAGIMLQFWDTAGQERFGALTASYVRDAHIVIIVYDATTTAGLETGTPLDGTPVSPRAATLGGPSTAAGAPRIVPSGALLKVVTSMRHWTRHAASASAAALGGPSVAAPLLYIVGNKVDLLAAGGGGGRDAVSSTEVFWRAVLGAGALAAFERAPGTHGVAAPGCSVRFATVSARTGGRATAALLAAIDSDARALAAAMMQPRGAAPSGIVKLGADAGPSSTTTPAAAAAASGCTC